MKRFLGVVFLVLCFFSVSVLGQDRTGQGSGGRGAETVPEVERRREVEPVRVRPPVVVKPNLSLRGFYLSKAEAIVGERVTATATVRLEGPEALGVVRVRFFMDNNAVGDQMVRRLSPGSEVRVSLDIQAGREGKHTLFARVNPDGEISETTGGDNQSDEVTLKCVEIARKAPSVKPVEPLRPVAPDRSVAPSVLPEVPSDLVLAELKIDKPNPSLGDEVTVTARIQNIGKRNFAGVASRLYVDGRPVGRILFADLGAGKTAEVKTSFQVEAAGTHEVKVQVDPENRIPEADDRGNNIKTLMMTALSSPLIRPAASVPGAPGTRKAIPEQMRALAPRPVLLIESLTPVRSVKGIHAEARIKNQSEQDLDKVRIEFYLGENIIEPPQYIRIAKGDTHTARISFENKNPDDGQLKIKAFPPDGRRFEKSALIRGIQPVAALKRPEELLPPATGIKEPGMRINPSEKPRNQKSDQPLSPAFRPPPVSLNPLLGTSEGITVTVPNTNSKISKGDTLEIKWEVGKTNTASFFIRMYDSKSNIVKPFFPILAKFPSKQGPYSYNWVIPEGFSSGKYTVRVSDIDGTYFGISDTFEIIEKVGIIIPGVITPLKTIIFNSPSVPGTVWNVGDDVVIGWNAFGMSGEAIKLYLIPMEFGVSSNIYITDHDVDEKFFKWKVPHIKDGYYKIRITDYPKNVKILAESEPVQILDVFANLFNKPSIKITSPLKNAKWFIGSTNLVKWDVLGPFDPNSTAMVSLIAPNGLAYSLSIPAVKLGTKAFSVTITPEWPIQSQEGQSRIRLTTVYGESWSEPFNLVLNTLKQPSKGTFKIQSIKTWRPGYDMDKIGTVEVVVQALTDSDFEIGGYGHSEFGSLYLNCEIINKKVWQDQFKQGYVAKETAFSGIFSCTGSGASKPLEYPPGLIKAGQTLKISFKLDPPVADHGVKPNYYPEITLQLFGHTALGQSSDSKTQAILGGPMEEMPPGQTIKGTM